MYRRKKIFFLLILLLLTGALISLWQEDAVAGRRVYHWYKAKAEVIYIGKHDAAPESGIFYITKKLSSDYMPNQIHALNVGQFIIVNMDKQASSPGTSGILNFRIEMDGSSCDQGRYQEKNSNLPKILNQINTSNRNYYYLIMTLENNGIKTGDSSILCTLQTARANNLIDSLDLYWLLKTGNKEKALAQLAKTDNYAQAYYLFYLLNHNKYQTALDLCNRHHRSLQQVIGNMHNFSESLLFHHVKVKHDKKLFKYYFGKDTGHVKLGGHGKMINLDLVKLIKLELLIKLKQQEQASIVAQSIFKDNKNILNQMLPGGYGMTYQGKNNWQLFQFPDTAQLIIRAHSILEDFSSLKK